MNQPIWIDKSKPLDVVAVGSWTNFDHLFKVDQLPMPGDTVQITSPIESVERVTWGGCAINNATASAKLGAKVGLISVVGEDFISRGYASYLNGLHIDTRGVIISQGELCGHSFLFSDPHGDAICISHLGASLKQEQYKPDVDMLSCAKVTVINYRFDKFTNMAATIARDNSSFVIASGNVATSRGYASDILKHIDMLICTQHELHQLIKLIDKDSTKGLFSLGIQVIIETHGVEGSLIIIPDNSCHVPSILSKNFVDPVGAGDGFTGGIATGISFGWSMEDSVKLGAVVASYVVEAYGCQTNQPTYKQAMQRLKDNKIVITDSIK